MKLNKKLIAVIGVALLAVAGTLLIWNNFGQSSSQVLKPAELQKEVAYAQELHAYDLQVLRVTEASNAILSNPAINTWNAKTKQEDKLLMKILRENNGIKPQGVPYPPTYGIPEGQIRQALSSHNRKQLIQAMHQLVLMEAQFSKVKVSNRLGLQSIADNLKLAAKNVSSSRYN